MKYLKNFGLLAIICAVIFSLAACTFSLDGFTDNANGQDIGGGSEPVTIYLTSDVSGNAVNVLAPQDSVSWLDDVSGESLEGAIITLTGQGQNTEVFTGIVSGEDGTWSIQEVKYGRYTLSATKAGWTFVPMTIDVLGLSTTLSKNLLAYPTPVDDTIYIISSWENTDYDIDSYMALSINEFASTPAASVVNWENTKNEEDDKSTLVANSVWLDRDVRMVSGELNGLPVETMRIVQNPFSRGEGYLRFYNYCYTADKSITGLEDGSEDSHPAAGLTVYVMQGTEHYGTFHVAENTWERALGIIQIDVTYANEETTYNIMSFGNANLYNEDGTIGVDAKALDSNSRVFDLTPVVVELDEIR